MWKMLLVAILFYLPNITSAAGLIPCGGPGQDPCQTCHVVQLISSVSGWLVAVLGVVAAILIIFSGLRLATSSGDASAKQGAKKMIASMAIGYVIVLAGWLMVDLVLKTFVTTSVYGVWNAIQCVAQPEAYIGRQTASGSNQSVMSPTAIGGQVTSITSSGSLQGDILSAATAAGITDPNQVKNLKALIAQESSNCTNKVGPQTSQGQAYGCGQITIPLAKELDPSLKTLSDSQIADKLRDDNAYNLTLSAKNYNNLLNKYNGDTDKSLAAYNGGAGANSPSADCPGLMRWQCVWDAPGCYGTSNTSCKPNTGYVETRNYVTNIKAVAQKL